MRVNCQKCNASILPETSEKYKGICKPCYKEHIRQQKINLPAESIDEDEWELSPENAHPFAKEILKDEFFWTIADDNSPLGNDDGADTLHAFYDWLKGNPTINRNVFLDNLLAGWEVKNDKWDLLTDRKIKNEIKRDDFSFFTRDNVVIALVFSQIVLEGKVDKEIKQKACWALQRQQNETVLEKWGEFKAQRKEKLQKMKEVLETFFNE